mmetsp:Transcript_13721/g.20906  ORF Transcript_13721/g.20906 Transcript_13721/m.20906 type:complete len:103 (-) Transcript_13721:435-743(-)
MDGPKVITQLKAARKMSPWERPSKYNISVPNMALPNRLPTKTPIVFNSAAKNGGLCNGKHAVIKTDVAEYNTKSILNRSFRSMEGMYLYDGNFPRKKPSVKA